MVFRKSGALLLLLLPFSAAAERLDLAPPSTEVAIRFYGLGFVPLDGTFQRFGGWLEHDSLRPGVCQVRLTIEAHSLSMSNTAIRDEIVGATYLDADRFPRLAYIGGCEGARLNGTLDMHGVRAPLQMNLEHVDGRVTATGRLRRADWGMTGGVMGGQTVRITVTIPRSNMVLRQAGR